MRIDAHQHFWQFDPIRHSWITESMHKIRRDFMPPDLEPVLRAHSIAACVAVQVDQTEAENDFLLTLAEEHKFIKGIVGWVDLNAESLNERLQYYKTFPRIKGFRHIVQAEPPGFLTDPGFVRGVNRLGAYGYSYDLLVYHHQLPEALEFVSKASDVRIVLDHLGKPPIARGEIDSWAANIARLAKFENVYCKLSGMVTEADWDTWTSKDLERYIDTVFRCFSARRLLYGSDWPVCLVAASYHQQFSAAYEYVAGLSEGERESVLGGNAITFYDL